MADGMQRRGFLGAILAAGMAPAFVGAKVLMPARALALPPPVLWAGARLTIEGGNPLLTLSEMTNRALYFLEDEVRFALFKQRLTLANPSSTITLTRPQRYLA